MNLLNRWRTAIVVGLLVLNGVAEAQQTGTLSGVVRDAQGGVLPGVTVSVSSPSLIGGARTAVTGEGGTYQFATLPPGTYVVTYELTGFAPLKRDGIVVQVARTTRVDVELGVGTLQETVTVSGASPVVDVSTTVTQTNITKDLFEAIPTGRNPWVMAGLVPGVVTGRLDVGGTEGMQQYNLEAFGSADSQKSFSIDGIKTNWAGGDGGATMMYYGFEMYEEYNMQTASGTAESDVVRRLHEHGHQVGRQPLHQRPQLLLHERQRCRATNVDDELRARLGLAPGQQTGAAGNPIDISYDWSSTLGGPIKRDKLWFFGALRWWRLDQFQVGALNPDGSQAIDDNRIRNMVGKLTWQTSQQPPHLGDLQPQPQGPLPSPRLALPVRRGSAPRRSRTSRRRTTPSATTRCSARGWSSTRRFGRMWGTTPSRYQSEVQPSDISIRDVNRFTIERAAIQQSFNPNDRYQGNLTASLFVDTRWRGGTPRHQGRHADSRARACSTSASATATTTSRHRDGVGFQAQLSQHADRLGPPARRPTARSCRTAGSFGRAHRQRRLARRRRQRLAARADQRRR